MKRKWQRVIAISIGVIMILSTIALIVPASSIPQPIQQPTIEPTAIISTTTAP